MRVSLADLVEQVIAALGRYQQPVRDHDVEVFGCQERQRLDDGPDRDDLEPQASKPARDGSPRQKLVIHDEDARGTSSRVIVRGYSHSSTVRIAHLFDFRCRLPFNFGNRWCLCSAGTRAGGVCARLRHGVLAPGTDTSC